MNDPTQPCVNLECAYNSDIRSHGCELGTSHFKECALHMSDPRAELRKVKVFDIIETNADIGPETEKAYKGEGWFHAWGIGFIEHPGGTMNYSTAIIEMKDGTIDNIPAQLIQFKK